MLLDSETKEDHINYESLPAVFVTTIIWRGIYIASRYYLPDKSKEYSSRICSFLHGLITAFLGINQCFLIDSPFDHPEWRTTYVQSFILAVSTGYFIHDSIWCIQNAFDDKLMIGHHVFSMVFLFQMLFKRYSGAQTACGLGSMELTNPFLQTRWFIRSAGFYPSVLFTSVETSFFIIYVVVRLILGSYVTWKIIHHPKNDWDFIVSSIIIYLISWMFFINMIKYVFRKYIWPVRVIDSNQENKTD